MARLRQRGDEVGLREYLLEEAVAFRAMYGHIDGCWDALSMCVDQLVGGEEYMFCRYLLPDDHPARMAGTISDRLVLTEDDVLLAGD